MTPVPAWIVCATCGQMVATNGDGTARKHQTIYGTTRCKGSGKR